MKKFTINALNMNRKNLEKLAYVANLEQIEVLASNLTDTYIEKALHIIQISSIIELHEFLKTKQVDAKYILISDNAKEIFEKANHLNLFYNTGGICILQNDWHDMALQKFLLNEKNLDFCFNNISVKFVTLISLFKKNTVTYGYVASIHSQGGIVYLFDKPNNNETYNYTIQCHPDVAIHGECLINNDYNEIRSGVWRGSLQFNSFDGFSKNILHSIINNQITCQPLLSTTNIVTNFELLEFIKTLLIPAIAKTNNKIDFLVSAEDFANTNQFTQYAWIGDVLVTWILNILNNKNFDKKLKWIKLQIKRNNTNDISLYLSVSIQNNLSIQTNCEGILEGDSHIRKVITLNDINFLRMHSFKVEQYPSEKFEHIAICLNRGN